MVGREGLGGMEEEGEVARKAGGSNKLVLAGGMERHANDQLQVNVLHFISKKAV